MELFQPKRFFKNTRSLAKCCVWVPLLSMTISAPIRDVTQHVSNPKGGIRSDPGSNLDGADCDRCRATIMDKEHSGPKA